MFMPSSVISPVTRVVLEEVAELSETERGEGGFGSVYRAVQGSPVEREVALKVLNPVRFDARSRLRFEAERQILAQLQQGDGDTAFEEPGPSGTQVLEPEAPPEPEGPAPEPPPVPPKADEVLDDLFAQLADNGMDLTELRAQMAEPQPMVEPDPDQIRDAFAQAGVDAPP